MSRSFTTTASKRSKPRSVMGPPEALRTAIAEANEVIDQGFAPWLLTPKRWPMRFSADPIAAKREMAEAAERLSGTSFYVQRGPGVTLARYAEALRTRELLLRLSQAASRAMRVRTTILRRSATIPLMYIRSIPIARVSRDGTVTVEEQPVRKHQPILEALHELDANRLRQCEQCQEIFWASRADQLVCSRKCRARKFRNLSEDKYRAGQLRYEESHPERDRRSGKANAKKPRVAHAKTPSHSRQSKRVARLPGSSKPVSAPQRERRRHR